LIFGGQEFWTPVSGNLFSCFSKYYIFSVQVKYITSFRFVPSLEYRPSILTTTLHPVLIKLSVSTLGMRNNCKMQFKIASAVLLLLLLLLLCLIIY